ncbi:MAG: hypothetical protein CMK09_10500 [Ponticaulis sp.]|nr:hypothetical protein [Ponticaulis sp.]|tara:strand:- start:6013 stop:7035 length:1023 start_codon:yes stop_codon:yes gene_type:complete
MSSSDPFQYFELDRKTATQSDVKRAYAKRLKTTRPEDDPAAFMTLRSKLDSALQQVKWREQNEALTPDYEDEDFETEEDDEDTDENEAVLTDIASGAPEETPDRATAETDIPANENDLDNSSASDMDLPDLTGASWDEPDDDPWAEEPDLEPQSSSAPAPAQTPFFLTDAERVRSAIEDITDLLNRPSDRVKWANWTAILDREAFDGLDVFQLLSSELRAFLCRHTGMGDPDRQVSLPPDIPASILIKIDDRFGWSQQSRADWYSRDQNIWISRLIDLAERATGTSTQANQQKKAWTAKPVTGKIQPGRMGFASAGWLIFWIFIRILIIITVIRLIIDLF